VVSRTKDSESYTFTYTDFLKVETIRRGEQVLHRFGYDANGVRVSERRADGTLVFFVGEYYEYSVNGTETHYQPTTANQHIFDDFLVKNLRQESTALGQGYIPGSKVRAVENKLVKGVRLCRTHARRGNMLRKAQLLQAPPAGQV
jgi:YD repeat-containing protein